MVEGETFGTGDVVIFDNPSEKCIDLEIYITDGFVHKLRLPDETAQMIVDCIQNKLNARFMLDGEDD
jgi:hypothetical protein